MKIKNTSETMILRRVEFPKNKPVEVKDESLLAKCLNMPEFVEVKSRAKNKD